ncbi:MAG: pitrilysin family protein [Solirubrobacterales bacterium]|nr:pitrilysin family protein [Solirubrobacterales bacterium]
MTSASVTTAANGMPIHRIALPGTRALTVLAAFDAGARTERPEENGMAHFLEHLVFKGGESYPTYVEVNETADRIGGVLNAYTSHDLVAFHITARAERAPEALDLLTDFVGRPRIDAEELDRERGVVIQEINRYDDQPSSVAEHLIDRAAFGDHPLGRSVLGPEQHLRETFTREGIVAFRERQWSGRTGGIFLVGNIDHLPEESELEALVGRFPDIAVAEPAEPAPALQAETLVERRDSNQSHLRLIYRPSVDVTDPRQRAALSIYSTLLGGSMGSRLFSEIREKLGLAYSVSAFGHAHADVPLLQLSAGLDSEKCVEAYARMREIVSDLRENGPTEEEVSRARSYAAGARVLAFERSGTVASYAAGQAIVRREPVDPDSAITALDDVSFDEVDAVARGIGTDAAVACVGPHDAEEFAVAG